MGVIHYTSIYHYAENIVAEQTKQSGNAIGVSQGCFWFWL